MVTKLPSSWGNLDKLLFKLVHFSVITKNREENSVTFVYQWDFTYMSELKSIIKHDKDKMYIFGEGEMQYYITNCLCETFSLVCIKEFHNLHKAIAL